MRRNRESHRLAAMWRRSGSRLETSRRRASVSCRRLGLGLKVFNTLFVVSYFLRNHKTLLAKQKKFLTKAQAIQIT